MINKSWFIYRCYLLKSFQLAIHAHLKLKVLYCTGGASRHEKEKARWKLMKKLQGDLTCWISADAYVNHTDRSSFSAGGYADHKFVLADFCLIWVLRKRFLMQPKMKTTGPYFLESHDSTKKLNLDSCRRTTPRLMASFVFEWPGCVSQV